MSMIHALAGMQRQVAEARTLATGNDVSAAEAILEQVREATSDLPPRVVVLAAAMLLTERFAEAVGGSATETRNG